MHLRNDWSSYRINALLLASLAAAIGAGGCQLAEEEPPGMAATEDEFASNLGPAALFEIDLSPDSRTMSIGNSEFYFVDVTPLEGFAGEVSLTVEASPPIDGSLNVSPQVVFPPDSAFLDVNTTCDVEPGDYTLTVTGTGDDGTTTTGAALLTVEPFEPPFAALFFFDEGLTFNFFASGSTELCDPIVLFQWDFGDGTTSTEQSPVHTYATRGEYTVTLTVTTESGLGDTTTEVVTALPPPFPLSIFRVTRDPATFEFRVDLRWSGAEGALLRLLRNNFEIDLPDNDGVHRDQFRTTSTSFEWQMCELEIAFCSNTVLLDVGPNGAIGDLATVRAVIDGREVVQSLRIEDGSEN
jgi:hypothetical protein